MQKIKPKYKIGDSVFGFNSSCIDISESGRITKIEAVLNGKSFHYTLGKFTFSECDIYDKLEDALDKVKTYYEWQMEDKIRSLTYQFLNRDK